MHTIERVFLLSIIVILIFLLISKNSSGATTLNKPEAKLTSPSAAAVGIPGTVTVHPPGELVCEYCTPGGRVDPGCPPQSIACAIPQGYTRTAGPVGGANY